MGVTVEGELDCLGGIENGHGAGLSEGETQEHLAPGEAEWFVTDRRGCPGCGDRNQPRRLQVQSRADGRRTQDGLDREEPQERLPNTHLVMHGSSSVPEELLDIIRIHGGYMKETYGVPVEEIQRGIKNGVRKFNVDSALGPTTTTGSQACGGCWPCFDQPWHRTRDRVRIALKGRLR